jgi:hypothetical protein
MKTGTTQTIMSALSISFRKTLTSLAIRQVQLLFKSVTKTTQ